MHCGVPFVYPGRFYDIIVPSRKRVFFVVQCLFKMKNDTRKITDGAMMAAIMGAAVLLDRQTAGLLQSLVLFLYPLPMVFYAVKYGWKNSLPVVAAIALLALVICDPASFVVTVLEQFIGLLYGSCIYAHVEIKRTVLWTILLSVIISVFTTFVFASFFGYNIMNEVANTENSLTTMFATLNMEIPANMDLEQTILTTLIVTVVLTGVLNAVVLHFISVMMFKRMHIQVENSIKLSEYMPPRWSGYAAIALAACFMYAANTAMTNTILRMTMEGVGACGAFYLLWYGMAAIVYYLNLRASMGKVLPVFLALLFALLTTIFVALLGFLYITTDMRQRLAQGGIKNE